MLARRLGSGCAAFALAGATALALPGAALAQPYDGPGNSENAPGQGNFATCPADADRTGNPGRCGRGAEMSVSSGNDAFDSGSTGEFGVESTYQRLGSFTANSSGAAVATFTVPSNLANGRHNVVFKGVKNGQPTTVRVPFTVSGTAGSAGAAGATRSSQLPRTGADSIAELTAAGITLVAVGGVIVVAARRRRDSMGSMAV
jgi:LPXTG-motif cell wall-anchored protein